MKDSGYRGCSLRKTAIVWILLIGFNAVFLTACRGNELAAFPSAAVEKARREKESDSVGAYQITDNSSAGDSADYIKLTEEGNVCYMRRPENRTPDSYLESEGAFRFEIPYGWLLGASELDEHLDVYWGEEDIPCFLWAIEDNDMGANAFSGNWDEVCENIGNTAKEVFGERLESIEFRKFTLEDGNDIYGVWCAFQDEQGETRMVSASYRFGEKYMLEFIGLDRGSATDIGNLTLYTAATYEEYGGERYREYEGAGHYKGMGVWEYKKLHNPFALAYEEANGKVWRQEKTLDSEDSVVEWAEPVLPDLIKEALEIEDRDIMASDLLQIDTLVLIEEQGIDRCLINEYEMEADLTDIGSGDALVLDVAKLKNLISLRLQIGDISDYSPLGSLEQLEVLELQAGRTVKDISFLEKLTGLQRVILEKASVQYYVDSLSDELWERTCGEWGITTFAKEYDGEQGLAFENMIIPEKEME